MTAQIENNTADEIEAWALRILADPETHCVRPEMLQNTTRVMRLWRYPNHDAFQAWHLFMPENDNAADDLVLESLLWNRPAEASRVAADPTKQVNPLIHTSSVKVSPQAKLHYQSVFDLHLKPFINSDDSKPGDVETGLSLFNDTRVIFAWSGDGPSEWKALDQWAEKMIQLLTDCNKFARVDSVNLVQP